jgi:RNA polymerase sigma-70 factor (ECF subfamily)
LSADDSPTDAELAARALNSDDAAFALLMARHKQWVHLFIRRYVGSSQDDSYDLLQETFFAAWQALARYQPALPFGAWLRSIALNKCRDRSRRNKVRRFLLGSPGPDSELPEVVDLAPGPEELASDAQRAQLLAAALRQLPRGLQEPLLLTTLEGLSHQAAGELLGISAKAVEMRVYRARAQLARLAGKL